MHATWAITYSATRNIQTDNKIEAPITLMIILTGRKEDRFYNDKNDANK